MIAALLEFIDARRLDLIDHLDWNEHRWQQTREESLDGLGCDADDGERAAAQSHFAPNDGAIAAVRAHPVVVPEHYHRVCAARDVVLRTEQPPNDGRETDEREVVAVHQLAGERLDVIAGVAREHAEL